MYYTKALLGLSFAFVISLSSTQAAIQYWDPSPDAGYQHGTGAWSTSASDTNWGTAATGARSTWTNGNSAYFSAVGGSSMLTINSVVTGNQFTIDGGAYTLVVTNGGRLTSTNNNAPHSIGSGANGSGNTVLIAGGAGVTSLWEQTQAQGKLYIGGPGNSQNSFRIDGAGVSGSAQFTSKDYVNLGNLGGFSNQLAIVNGGSMTCGALNVTDGCTSNMLTVSGGAGVVSRLSPTSIKFGAGTSGYLSTNNVLLVDGMNVDGSAIVTNTSTTTVGLLPGDTGNGISLLNGGWFYSAGLTAIGSGVGLTNNYLIVDNARYTCAVNLTLGYNASATRNSLVVTNGGKLLLGSSTGSAIGTPGARSNSMAVVGGAGGVSLVNASAHTFTLNGSNSTLLIDGLGVTGSAIMTNAGISVGDSGGTENSVTLRNGGVLNSSGSTSIGASSTGTTGPASNVMTVAGSGSLLTCGSFLQIGYRSANNRLIVTNGGRILIKTSSQSLCVGQGQSAPAGANNNSLLIAGGVNGTSMIDVGGSPLWVGYNSATGNTAVIDAGGVDGGAYVTNTSTLEVPHVGSVVSAYGNTLTITNKGALYLNAVNGVAASIGTTRPLIVSNAVLVAAGGKLVSAAYNPNGGTSSFQVSGSNSTLTVKDPGSLFQLAPHTIRVGYASPCIEDAFIIDNYAVATNVNVVLGQGASSADINFANRLVINGGGKLYGSTAAGSGGSGNYIGHTFTSANTGTVSGVNSLWDLGGSALGVGFTLSSNNTLAIDQGGAVLRVAAFTLGSGSTSQFNRVTLTTPATLYSSGPISIGGALAANGNTALVSGASALWNAGNQPLTIGLATSTNNAITLTQGGTIDAISTLTVLTNNSVNLLGGTLGVKTTTYTNGLFTVGDGAQAATLKSLGGTLAFTRGLVINTNATLTGGGTVSGSSLGVTLTNGAILNPGLAGPGSLTMGGSNFTWTSGGVYNCEITDMNLGQAVGWDVVNVSSQLVLSGSGLIINMDAMGAAATNFDAARDYNIRILNYGSQVGFDAAMFTIETNTFPGSVSAWSITNGANALWLVYRGSAGATGATLTWDVPKSGNWSVGGNWTGLTAPGTGGSSTNIMIFGDNGTPYYSTNDYAGTFTNNQLQLSSASSVTNYIKGGVLALANNGATGARVDYLAGNDGTVVISNSVLLTTDTEFGGNAIGSTLRLGGAVTNFGTLTKKGTWTLALTNANNFIGPVVVNGPDGTLRLDNVNALNGSGPVIVSNGTLAVNQGVLSYYFANNQHNRRGQITGTGSVWTNWAGGNLNFPSGFASGSTNVSVLIDGGKMFWNVRFQPFDNGSSKCNVIVTNGGQLVASGYAPFLAWTSTNNTMVITGTNSLLLAINLALNIGENGSFGNTLRIENGAMATNYGALIVSGSITAGNKSNSLIITNEGKVYTENINIGSGIGSSNNSIRVTGLNSYLRSASGVVYVGGIGACYNSLTVDNGALMSVVRIIMSSTCTGNVMTVRNGGRLIHASASASSLAYNPGAISNEVVVTDSGSEWNLGGGTLKVSEGNTSSWNRLTISNNGVFTNVTTLTVADGIGSSNNSVWVNGGKLYATTLAFANPLVNSVQMDGASEMVVTTLFVTNANQSLTFNGGTLTIRNGLVSNTFTFVVGNGTDAASLAVPAGGTNTFANGLVVTNGATLTGAGTIAATSTVYGTLSPGMAGIGVLTNKGDFIMKPGAAAKVEMGAYTTPGSGWDLLSVTNGTLTLNGTLSVLLTSGFAPTNTQSFVIMTNQTASSTIANQAAFGSQVAARATEGGRVAGYFNVAVSSQSVVLNGYTAQKAIPGTLFFIR